MSIFSKLFKLFLVVVFLPLIPMLLLLGYYQVHLKDNILDTHANLAEMVATSMTQHIEDLSWRLAFASQVTQALTKKTTPVPVLEEALAANPDFVFLAVLSKDGTEKYRAAMSQKVSEQIASLDFRNDPALAGLTKEPHLLVSSFEVLNGRPISEFLYPLPNGDYLYGVLSFFGFLARVQQQRIGNTGHIYIVDQSGNVYVSDYQYAPAFDVETFERAFASNSPLIKSIKTPHHTYVGAYATTPVLGVHVAVLQLKSEAYRSIYYTNIILALFLLTIATLAYFGALTFAEQLGEPVAALSQAAAQVSKGNFDVQVDPEIGWGEFKRLINDFNQMTVDLKDYQALRLQAQVSELKEQVFRAVAHDLRAPLMGLQGYIYILQNGKDLPEGEKQNYLKLMGEAAQNLSVLLEDVLDVSRLEAGMANVQKCKVDVKNLVRAVLDTIRPSAEQKGLTLSTQINTDHIWVDPKVFKRVLTNLVSNAVKFTEKGFVKVVALEEEKSYTVKVEDSGIGLSAQEIKGLFQKYHQVHADKPGYGLGLFISRQLVQAHGGTLEVSSLPGKGSTFIIHVPKEQA
ncbi:MAG: sensor histidine kinase [Elusimicrobiaceae bacterium]|nr:sensor histidine kinase [Elusimicrobiaceae bacterium]